MFKFFIGRCMENVFILFRRIEILRKGGGWICFFFFVN